MWKLTLGYRIIFTTLGEIIQNIVSLLLHVEIFFNTFLKSFSKIYFWHKWRESIVGEKTPVQKFLLAQIPQ